MLDRIVIERAEQITKSGKKLAEHLGVPPSHVSMWKKGRPVPIDKTLAMCQLIGIDGDDAVLANGIDELERRGQQKDVDAIVKAAAEKKPASGRGFNWRAVQEALQGAGGVGGIRTLDAARSRIKT